MRYEYKCGYGYKCGYEYECGYEHGTGSGRGRGGCLLADVVTGRPAGRAARDRGGSNQAQAEGIPFAGGAAGASLCSVTGVSPSSVTYTGPK